MKYKKEGNRYVLVLDKGDEVIASIQKLADDENIDSGFVSGIGAADKVEIAIYNTATKEYSSKMLDMNMEICSLNGNITNLDGKKFAHLHGVFSDSELKCYGGHVKSALISVTCEITIAPFSEMKRKKNEEIGLNLIDL